MGILTNMLDRDLANEKKAPLELQRGLLRRGTPAGLVVRLKSTECTPAQELEDAKRRSGDSAKSG